MVLSSTLIIDKSESFQRTEANHASAWFGRFALSLGPMLGIVFARTTFSPLLASSILALAAFILLATVKFPFRTPEDGVKKFSGDRFFLPEAKWLFGRSAYVHPIHRHVLCHGDGRLLCGITCRTFRIC